MGDMKLNLKIWRQKDSKSRGKFVKYTLDAVSPDVSFLEMLDLLNETLEKKGEEPVAFDHDCREGICGMCLLVINGRAHGPDEATTTCQLHMRRYKNNQTLIIEPVRAKAFPVIKDLIVDRSAFDRIIQAGGYNSINCGGAPDSNAVLITKPMAEKAMDAAACLGCGACVASCKNASSMLFVSAKISQFALLPQGHPERTKRALAMVKAMDDAGFGNCTNESECEATCPAEITVDNIARLNREYIRGTILGE
ncbi:succinate dehydrogenase/fumarate reductase iron-sulfur subunit [Candidatus Riflebacteria bacterium]